MIVIVLYFGQQLNIITPHTRPVRRWSGKIQGHSQDVDREINKRNQVTLTAACTGDVAQRDLGYAVHGEKEDFAICSPIRRLAGQ